MTRYTPFAVELKVDGDVTSSFIAGVDSQSIDTGVAVTTEVSAGSETPHYGEINVIQPGGSFSSRDISTLLQAIGMRGSCLTEATGPGFAMYGLQREPCGSLKSGSVHQKWSIGNGLIVPQSLTAQQGSRASLTAMVYSFYDGTNDPLIIQSSQAAPTGLPADINGYHMGPVSLAGVTITKKTSVQVDWGISVQPQFEDGESFAGSLFVAEYKPVVTITVHDVALLGSGAIPLRGLHGTQANTSLVFRKRTLGTGAFESGADHLKFDIDGIVSVRPISASTNQPESMQIVLNGLDDQTNDMIVPTYDHTLV